MIFKRFAVRICLCIGGGGGGGNRNAQLYVLVGARYGEGWLRVKNEVAREAMRERERERERERGKRGQSLLSRHLNPKASFGSPTEIKLRY